MQDPLTLNGLIVPTWTRPRKGDFFRMMMDGLKMQRSETRRFYSKKYSSIHWWDTYIFIFIDKLKLCLIIKNRVSETAQEHSELYEETFYLTPESDGSSLQLYLWSGTKMTWHIAYSNYEIKTGGACSGYAYDVHFAGNEVKAGESEGSGRRLVIWDFCILWFDYSISPGSLKWEWLFWNNSISGIPQFVLRIELMLPEELQAHFYMRKMSIFAQTWAF